MRALFWVGLVVLILGVLAFFVPFPQQETHGVEIGDAQVGVQTESRQKLPPVVGAVMCVVGGVMMIASRRK